MTEPLKATTWLSRLDSRAAVSLSRLLLASASFLNCQRANRQAATMALERREMEEARR